MWSLIETAGTICKAVVEPHPRHFDCQGPMGDFAEMIWARLKGHPIFHIYACWSTFPQIYPGPVSPRTGRDMFNICWCNLCEVCAQHISLAWIDIDMAQDTCERMSVLKKKNWAVIRMRVRTFSKLWRATSRLLSRPCILCELDNIFQKLIQ